MTLEENKAIVRRQLDLIQSGQLDALGEVMATDVANYALGRVQVGLEAFKQILRAIHETIPDEITTVDDVIAESDKVVVRSTLRGRHQKSSLPMFADIQSAGKPVVWEFIHIFRIRGGKIVEHWAQRNDLEVRQQLQAAEDTAA